MTDPQSTPDSINYKTCTGCGRSLPATLDYFGPHKGKLRPRCRECHRAENLAYYYRNRELIRERARHHKRDPEKQRAAQKRWREANPEKARACYKKWYANNPTYHREWRRARPGYDRKYIENNREKVRETHRNYRRRVADKENARTRDWRRRNPEKVKALKQRRRAMLNAAPGSHTAADIALQYEAQKGLCWWCGKPVGETYDVDHRIPLSKGGSNDASNIVISCPYCNASKGAKLPHEWNGRLL